MAIDAKARAAAWAEWLQAMSRAGVPVDQQSFERMRAGGPVIDTKGPDRDPATLREDKRQEDIRDGKRRD